MSDLPSLAQLKATHDALYKGVLEKRRVDSTVEAAVARLLKNINAISPFTKDVDDYLWLMDTCLQWQGVYSTILKKPARVEIPNPSDDLQGPPVLTPPDISSVITQIADVISLFRRGKQAERKMHAPSSKHDEAADWHYAQVYICLEFLTEKRDFVREAPPGSYECLENIWLQDVIQLKAYQNWQVRGAPEDGTEEQAKSDYYDSCDFFRVRLTDQALKHKYDKDDFRKVFRYLLKYFEDDGRTLAEPAIKQLIERKADRYARALAKKSDRDNWCDAAGFVHKFYGNIISAISQEASTGIREVTEAIVWSEGKESRIEIMNCLEAAICIYFLKGFEESPEVWKTQTIQR